MKAFLSGMPECKFGMNDKLVMVRLVALVPWPRHACASVETALVFSCADQRWIVPLPWATAKWLMATGVVV